MVNAQVGGTRRGVTKCGFQAMKLMNMFSKYSKAVSGMKIAWWYFRTKSSPKK